MKSICVFCGSSHGAQPAYTVAARALASTMVKNDIELVYGGGNVGLMGVIGDTVMQSGGKVTGVIPKPLMEKEVGHEGLTNLHVVADMHERKALMASLSEGFIALPGGWGTLEELFEVMTWLQLGFHEKPCAVYNVNNYFDSLLAFLGNATEQGFVKRLHHDMLIHGDEPEALLQRMSDFTPPDTKKWIGFGE